MSERWMRRGGRCRVGDMATKMTIGNGHEAALAERRRGAVSRPFSGATLAITRETTKVALSSQHLVIATQAEGSLEERKSTVPLGAVGRVVVYGYPRITFPAILRLAAEGIPCHFLTEGGRWKASLQGVGPEDGARRMLQCRRAEDEAFSLRVGRALVEAKVLNGRRALQRLAANRGRTDEAGHREACRALRRAAREAQGARTPGALRGVEGQAAAIYFAQLGGYFPSAVPFRGRERHPARDAANALLSYAYGVLTGEMEAAIRMHGLDPAVGHMHVPGARPSLALDLLEPFRPAVADLLALDLLNHGVLEPDRHFEQREDGAVWLSAEGRKMFFARYERAMRRRFRPRNDAPPTTFRQLLEAAVLEYLDALESGRAPVFFRLP